MTDSAPKKQTILFLASNPDGLRRVGAELREIEDGLEHSTLRDAIDLEDRLAVRPRDIQRALLKVSPQIIHFTGSSTGQSGLIFEDNLGNPKEISVPALAGLFSLFADEIKCVVLNGCYTEEQANAIAQHIDYVIGMQQEVASEAAIAFSVGFYDAIGAGRNIEFAFKLACNSLQIEGVDQSPEPILIKKGQVQAGLETETSSAEIQVKLWSVPTLPLHFLSRPETIKVLKENVLSSLDQPVVMTGQSQRIGVQGMGGIGKTVLATALAYDPEVQEAFPDGIYWVTVGTDPNLLTQQSNLAQALDGQRLVFDDLNQGKTKLKELWQGKQSLLILDDVWNLADAEAFNVLGERSTLLITTRDAGLVTGLGAKDFSLDVLNDAQALELLAAWANVPLNDLPPEAKAIADECGNLPLALAQCGAMVRDLAPWEDILSDLKGAKLEAIACQFSHYPDASVFKALHKSALVLKETNPIAGERYQELAVFPVDTLIPESVVVRLWQHTGGLAEKDARKILAMLARKGMLRLEGDYPKRRISLHDLQQDYLQSQVSDRPGLHGQLLSAYQSSCPEGWHSGPNDGYFYQHLATHLKQAERENELRSLLLDYRWIERKLTVTDINTLLLDYDILPSEPDLKFVASGLRLSSHVLSRRPEELRSQLYGRLLSLESTRLSGFKRSLRHGNGENWWRCLWPALTQAGGALLRTLSGHSSSVSGVTVTPDGQYIISASSDKTLKVWELKTGCEVMSFYGEGAFQSCTIAPDGRTVVAGDSGGQLYFLRLEGPEFSDQKEAIA